MDDCILTPEQAAKELSLKTETVRALMRKGELPAAKVGGSWRTTRRALYGYLENQMGLSGRRNVQGKKVSSERILQVHRRSAAVGKRIIATNTMRLLLIMLVCIVTVLQTI